MVDTFARVVSLYPSVGRTVCVCHARANGPSTHASQSNSGLRWIGWLVFVTSRTWVVYAFHRLPKVSCNLRKDNRALRFELKLRRWSIDHIGRLPNARNKEKAILGATATLAWYGLSLKNPTHKGKAHMYFEHTQLRQSNMSPGEPANRQLLIGLTKRVCHCVPSRRGNDCHKRTRSVK